MTDENANIGQGLVPAASGQDAGANAEAADGQPAADNQLTADGQLAAADGHPDASVVSHAAPPVAPDAFKRLLEMAGLSEPEGDCQPKKGV